MLEKLTIKNVPQVEGALAEMSAISRKLSLIEGAMNEEIDSAKARAQQESASLIARNSKRRSRRSGHSTRAACLP